METNNVLIIPGADFSDAAVENIFTLCNESFYDEKLISRYDELTDWDVNKVFLITRANNYQDKPLGKIVMATGENSIQDRVTVYKIKPKSGSEGSYVVNKSDLELLFTIDFESKSKQLMDIVFPRSITLKKGEYLCIECGYNDECNFKFLSADGLVNISYDNDITLDYRDTKTANSVGIYSVE